MMVSDLPQVPEVITYDFSGSQAIFLLYSGSAM